MRRNRLGIATAILVVGGLAAIPMPARAGNITLNFNGLSDPYVSSYSSQGFDLTSTGGFNLNSPTTGGGGTIVGSNFYYAGPYDPGTGAPIPPFENGLTPIGGSDIELKRTDLAPFSLLSIELARDFAYNSAPTVTLVGHLVGGGTVTAVLTVNNTLPIVNNQLVNQYQHFALSGFTNLTSVTWTQPSSPTDPDGQHQFGPITLSTVPEPSSLALGAIAIGGGLVLNRRRKGRRFQAGTTLN